MTLPAHARDLTVQGLKLIQDGFPVLASALNELINAVFVADDSSSLGGSRSDRVGILWISPQAGWTSTTYAEAIAHECVHTAIFLQDMVFGLYVMDEDELAQAGGLVTSAIRRTPRRFDLAFHSAFVAYTLSSFYRELNEREKADSYIAPLIVCLRDLSQKSWLLSDLGKQMLRELIEQTLLWTNTSQKNSLPMV
jgi:HEXXH motif-containing protein